MYMRFIYWLLPLVIFGTIFLTGYLDVNLFYIWLFWGVITGAVLIFPQKTQKSWEHLPKLIIGSFFYGLLTGIFIIAIPIFYSIQEPSITLDHYFKEFVFSWLRSILEIGGASSFINFMSGLAMIVAKGFYYLFWKNRKVMIV